MRQIHKEEFYDDAATRLEVARDELNHTCDSLIFIREAFQEVETGLAQLVHKNPDRHLRWDYPESLEKIEEFLSDIQSSCNRIKKQCSYIGKKQRNSLQRK